MFALAARGLIAAALLGLLDAGVAAAAPAEGDNCAGSYERAQEERSEGHLVDARSELLVCAQTSCPEFIMQDCRRWLDEVEAAIPTVVFAVREGGKDLEEVLVTREGKLIANRLDGRAVPVDPGKQKFVFELPGNRQRTLEALIVEGEKSRVIALDVPPPDDIALTEYGGARAVTTAPAEGELPRLPLILAGVGAVGIGGFAGFALTGWREEASLDRRCAPRCTSREVESVRRKYTLADVSLGVGVGALAVAGYLYFRERPVSLSVGWVPGGAFTGVSRSF